MGPRKVSRTPKKLNKKFSKTRSKKQRGSGIAYSRQRHIEPKVQNVQNVQNVQPSTSLHLGGGLSSPPSFL